MALSHPLTAFSSVNTYFEGCITFAHKVYWPDRFFEVQTTFFKVSPVFRPLFQKKKKALVHDISMKHWNCPLHPAIVPCHPFFFIASCIISMLIWPLGLFVQLLLPRSLGRFFDKKNAASCSNYYHPCLHFFCLLVRTLQGLVFFFFFIQRPACLYSARLFACPCLFSTFTLDSLPADPPTPFLCN